MKKIFPYLFVIIIIFLGACTQNSQDAKLDAKVRDLEIKLKGYEKLLKDSSTETSFQDKISKQQVADLETKVNAYESFLNSLEGSLGQLGNVLSGLQSLLTILAVVFAAAQAFQYVRSEFKEARNQKREQGRIDDMLKREQEGEDRMFENLRSLTKSHQDFIERLQIKQDEALIRQEDKNKDLMEAVRGNVSETTKLITSYKDLISLQKIAQDLGDVKAEAKRLLQTEQIILNNKAIRQVNKAFIEQRGAIYLPYWKDNFEDFSREANAFIRESKIYDLKTGLNADAYFIIGLHMFLGGQLKDAETYFEKAIQDIKRYLAGLLTQEEKAVLFPEASKDLYKTLEAWSTTLLGRVDFYLGLSHYRLGNYGSAGKYFEEAKKYLTEEADAWFFYFQSNYWGETFSSLSEGRKEMLDYEKDIQKTWEQRKDGTMEMIKARLFMKLGDFSIPIGSNGKYGQQKNLSESVGFYKQAYLNVQSLNGDIEKLPKGFEHLAPMVFFAYGRAIKTSKDAKEKVEGHPSWEELFLRTESFCKRFDMDVENPETKYLLFYIRAKCQQELGRSDEAKESIRKAMEYLKAYCSNPGIQGYSPISNLMLNKDDLYDELKNFDRSLG